MRSTPADLAPEDLRHALRAGWRLPVTTMRYVPEGGGSYHWKLACDDGRAYFVTVDDLDGKDWLGDTREAVLGGLRRALGTAAALRHEAGLDFVLSPIADCDGAYVRPAGSRYTVSVFPFLPGRSCSFGPYADARLRNQVLAIVAALHQATAAVRGRAPAHVLGFGGRGDLDAFVLDPSQPWRTGPFAAETQRLLAPHVPDIARLTAGFDRLAGITAAARADGVITHGEPHPGNVMRVGGCLLLIDWDTAAIAPPERDVSLIATAGSEDLDRYQAWTGRDLDPAVITLYRLRWYLDDLGSAIRMFRNRHQDTADTRRWRNGLAKELARLPSWLQVLA